MQVTGPSDQATSLLGSQPAAAAAGPVLTVLLSLLKWADSLCAVAAPGEGYHGRGSSGSGGIEGL